MDLKNDLVFQVETFYWEKMIHMQHLLPGTYFTTVTHANGISYTIVQIPNCPPEKAYELGQCYSSLRQLHETISDQNK
jgi:hypothetical protein